MVVILRVSPMPSSIPPSVVMAQMVLYTIEKKFYAVIAFVNQAASYRGSYYCQLRLPTRPNDGVWRLRIDFCNMKVLYQRS